MCTHVLVFTFAEGWFSYKKYNGYVHFDIKHNVMILKSCVPCCYNVLFDRIA